MKVVIIEDDPEITELVSAGFETGWPGIRVVSAPNAAEGMEMLTTENPDVLILGLDLPKGDTHGYVLFEGLCTFSEVPIIIISARVGDLDIVRGLESGAAAYLTKPFSIVELLARTGAIMRRVQAKSLTETTQPFVSKDLSVDFDNRQVVAHGELVDLTPIEYELLCYLIRNPRQILTNHAILREIWGEESQDRGSIKACIQRLRKKLKDDSLNPRLIATKRGRGYWFVGGEEGAESMLLRKAQD